MNFQIEYYNRLIENPYKQQVRSLVSLYGDEFFPPLSKRSSTVQQVLSSQTDKDNIYYEELLKQPGFICLKQPEMIVIGFISFVKDYMNDQISKYCPSYYVTTIIIDNKYRRLGVGERLYNSVIQSFNKPFIITTRTWSENISHIKLLKKLGFNLIKTLPNHRAKGVHTVYYALEVS